MNEKLKELCERRSQRQVDRRRGPVAPGPVGAGGEGDRSPAGGAEKGDPVQPESGAEYEDQEIGELG